MSKGINRRTMMTATGGAIALAAIGNRAGAQQASPAASGDWSFTDDKGVTVTLPAAPQRIVADVNAAAALWDFGIRPVGVFGWNASETGDFGPAGGNIDPAQVAVGGNATEPFQAEPVLAMQPDLLVTITWEPENPTEYWSLDFDEGVLPVAQEIAPILAISAVGFADENTARMAELAVALGADLSSPELTAASETYEAALTQLPEVATERAELDVIFTYIGDGEQWYIVDPVGWADVSLYQRAGVNVIVPEESDGYWQTLSFEDALKYPADVMFNSSRGGGTLTLSLEDLQAHPTFSQHPAVKAGQVGDWNQDFIMSFQGMTDAINAIITTLEAAEKVTQ